jgi:hypothetical protein
METAACLQLFADSAENVVIAVHGVPFSEN